MTTAPKATECSVVGCRNNSARSPLMTFFRLPARPERRQDWLKLMNREDLIANKNWVQHRICEMHFKQHHFQADLGNDVLEKKLTRFALPTLCMPVEVRVDKANDPCITAAEASTSTSQESSVKMCDISTQTVKYEEDELKTKASRFKALCDKYLPKEMSEKIKAQMIAPSEEYQPALKKIKTEVVESATEYIEIDIVKTETFFT